MWTCWPRPRRSTSSASASPSSRQVVLRLCSLQQRPRGQAAQEHQPRRTRRLHPVALRGVQGDQEARLRLLPRPQDHRRPRDHAPRISRHVRYAPTHLVSPHFQQSRIENEYLIEREINDNLKKKSINAHVGDARFWKAIDDSFESTEVAKVQRHVGDPEPTQFELRTSKVELEVDSEGKVVNVHPKH